MKTSDITIEIHHCPEHGESVVYVNGKDVISNDYSTENLERVCEHLGMKVKYVEYTSDEFEKKYA